MVNIIGIIVPASETILINILFKKNIQWMLRSFTTNTYNYGNYNPDRNKKYTVS